MLTISNMSNVKAKIQRTTRRVEDSVNAQVVAKLKAIFRDAVKATPQWSGNMAFNWTVNLGWAKGDYIPIPNYLDPKTWESRHADFPHYRKGLNPALEGAVAKAFTPEFSFHSKAYLFAQRERTKHRFNITNVTPYAAEVEEGIGPVPYYDMRTTKGKEAFAEYGDSPKLIRKVNTRSVNDYAVVQIKSYIMMKYKHLGQ